MWEIIGSFEIGKYSPYPGTKRLKKKIKPGKVSVQEISEHCLKQRVVSPG